MSFLCFLIKCQQNTNPQQHIQVGAGLVQKVRLAIVLLEGEGNIWYFTVVKGNYCPKQYKENALELHFSEETFLFSNSCRMIPTNELGTQTDTKNGNDEKYNELETIAISIFGDKLVSTGNFVKKYCEIKNKSIPTAKRAYANLIKFDLIEKFLGVYRLKESMTADNEETEEENDDIAF